MCKLMLPQPCAYSRFVLRRLMEDASSSRIASKQISSRGSSACASAGTSCGGWRHRGRVARLGA